MGTVVLRMPAMQCGSASGNVLATNSDQASSVPQLACIGCCKTGASPAGVRREPDFFPLLSADSSVFVTSGRNFGFSSIS